MVVVVGGLVGGVVVGAGGLVGGVVVGAGATGIGPPECEPGVVVVDECVGVVEVDVGAGAAGAELAFATWTAVPLVRTVNHMLKKPWPMAAVRFLSPEKK